MSRSQRNFLGLGLLLLGVAGCSSKASAALEKTRFEVSGTVLIDGKPAERVMVVFVPAAANAEAHQGFGVTDSEGEFQAENFQQQSGLPPGQYIALLTRWMTPEGELPPPDTPPADVRAMQVIPPKWNAFSNAGKHNLITVTETGATGLKFEVTMKD